MNTTIQTHRRILQMTFVLYSFVACCSMNSFADEPVRRSTARTPSTQGSQSNRVNRQSASESDQSRVRGSRSVGSSFAGRSRPTIYFSGMSASDDDKSVNSNVDVHEDMPQDESTGEHGPATSEHTAASDHESVEDSTEASSDSSPQFFDAPIENPLGMSGEESQDGAPVTSATESFKQMLLRKRDKVNAPGDSGSQSSSEETGRRISTLPPSIESQLNSDDPLRQAEARRFIKLRDQLLQLKSRLKTKEESHSPAKSTSAAHDTSNMHGDTHQSEDSHESHSKAAPDDDATSHASDDHSSDSDGVSGHEQDVHAEPEHGVESHGDGSHETELHGVETHHADSEAHDDQGGHGAGSSHADPADAGSGHSEAGHGDAAHGDSGHATEEDHGMDQAHGSEESHETTEGHEHGTDEHASMATGAVPDPIDRVSLGNNLYALGEYPAAYKAYLSANPEELTPEQQFWVEYQIANCLRRMGEHSEASNRFRKLAGQPEAGWLSERAGWWVDVLEQIRRTENALKQETSAGRQNQAQKKLPISSANKGGSHNEHRH